MKLYESANNYDNVLSVLQRFESVSLDEIEAVKLMNRIDTKYVMRIEEVIPLLQSLINSYSVLQIASQRVGSYNSVYFDTEDWQMFQAHITGRYPRFKIRERCYSQNNLTFFEIKQKGNNGRTVKKRICMGTGAQTDAPLGSFISDTPFCFTDLKPKLTNFFDRVTLVNKEKTERVTLDFNLRFRSEQGKETPSFQSVVILEIKQCKRVDSPLRSFLKEKNIRKSGMSKYCVGTLLLNSELAFKKYKPTFTHFIKLQNGKYDRL